MAWWLYRAKLISKMGLRIYFAAHEMAERRRYTRPDEITGENRRPLYTIDEIKALVGQRADTESAEKALSAEVKKLGRLGLVRIGAHAIDFAVSVDQLAVDDISGFWAFFEQLPNHRRSVPVPRRTVRALAGGFTRTMMGLMIALMIRSLYWHKNTPANQPVGKVRKGGSGEKAVEGHPTQRAGRDASIQGMPEAKGSFRVDGRTKCSWVVEVFGVARRGVTDAWARLVELGWIEPIEVPQWQLNKWGQHYTIATHAFAAGWRDTANTEDDATAAFRGQEERGGSAVPHPQDRETTPSASPNRPGNTPPETEEIYDLPGGGFASPKSSSESIFASPCLNKSAFPIGKYLNTKKPAPQRSGPPAGSREKNVSVPSMRRVLDEDLRDTGRLLELHAQFVDSGLCFRGEAGRLDFIALAERARAIGNKPVRLFVWLVRNERIEFITQADEDRAAQRLRQWIDPRPRNEVEERDRQARALDQGEPWSAENRASSTAVGEGTPGSSVGGEWIETLSDDVKFVLACIRIGRQHKVDPFRIAQTKGWDKRRWDIARAGYEQKDRQRWVR
jgi:hypothetical protein